LNSLAVVLMKPPLVYTTSIYLSTRLDCAGNHASIVEHGFLVRNPGAGRSTSYSLAEDV
jgi:hypothetical protein